MSFELMSKGLEGLCGKNGKADGGETRGREKKDEASSKQEALDSTRTVVLRLSRLVVKAVVRTKPGQRKGGDCRANRAPSSTTIRGAASLHEGNTGSLDVVLEGTRELLACPH